MRTFRRSPLTPGPLWRDDPKSAYGKFLQYVGEEVNAVAQRNQRVFNLFKQQPVESFTATPEVSVENGSFDDFKTCLSLPLYCSKITIQNVEMANFVFKFGADIIPRILDMNVLYGVCPDFKIARRTIVPAEFREAPQLAGPMGYHEYLIDGNNSRISSLISFRANSEYPIKIVLENCKGCVGVMGLDQDAIDRIFTVVNIVDPNCDKELIFKNCERNQSRPGKPF